MKRFWRYLKAIRPSAIRAAAVESGELFRVNRRMKDVLEVIADFYGCRDIHCDLHRLKPNSDETEFLCTGCAASMALSGKISLVRIPVAPEVCAFHLNEIPEEQEFGSVMLLKRRAVQ